MADFIGYAATIIIVWTACLWFAIEVNHAADAQLAITELQATKITAPHR